MHGSEENNIEFEMEESRGAELSIVLSLCPCLGTSQVVEEQSSALAPQYFARLRGFGLSESLEVSVPQDGQPLVHLFTTNIRKSSLAEVLKLCGSSRYAEVDVFTRDVQEDLLFSVSLDVSSLLTRRSVSFLFDGATNIVDDRIQGNNGDVSQTGKAKLPISVATCETGQGEDGLEDVRRLRIQQWDGFRLTFEVDEPVLDAEAKAVLNPFEIEIASFDCLPNHPVSIDEMSLRFLPPYAILSVPRPPSLVGPVLLSPDEVEHSENVKESDEAREKVSVALQDQDFTVKTPTRPYSKKVIVLLMSPNKLCIHILLRLSIILGMCSALAAT